MDVRFESHVRLEPLRTGEQLDRGFRAEIHDPLWFLARQWQLGEHRGEDASSPVEVLGVARSVAMRPLPDAPELPPMTVPPECVVESERGDWWTPGRRIRLGQAFARAHALPEPAQAKPSLLVSGLPVPYRTLDGRAYDGRALWREHPKDPLFTEVPRSEPLDRWDPEVLSYSARFPSEGPDLVLDDHRGGQLDWYSVDASAEVGREGTLREFRVLPTRVQYPGAPHPRWWQIEDARVDIGGFPPSRGHFATLLLIDLVVSHSDDWFGFPVDGSAGHIVDLGAVEVRDSFDEIWKLAPPDDWAMFRVRGLQPTAMLLWPSVAARLEGVVVEDVQLAVDEQANLLWAVEQRAGARELHAEPSLGPAPRSSERVEGSARQGYHYAASGGAREHWHPYTLSEVRGADGVTRRRFVQARLGDLSGLVPKLFPEPQCRVLVNPSAGPNDPVHAIEPGIVPSNGMRLQRRWVLARRTSGEPMLWVQRQRLPLAVAPQSLLRFDLLEPEDIPSES